MPKSEKEDAANSALIGFEKLEKEELKAAEKIVDSYLKKIKSCGKLEEMRLSLTIHPHGKSFKHEINGIAFLNNKRFSSHAMEWNVYNAVHQVCDKILSEIKHSNKKEQRHDKVTFK